MKYSILLFITLFIAVNSHYSQNVGVNQTLPVNSLHVSPVNVGDNPIRIDGLQSYNLNDTSLLIVDQATGVLKYIGTSDFVSIINTSNTLGTDNQNIDSVILSGATLTVYIENGTSSTVDLSTLQDADSDPTNEIELPATAVTNQVLTWNGASWVAQNAGAGADNWGTQTVFTGTGISGNGTTGSPLVNTFTEVDGVIGNEYNTGVSLSGTTLSVTDGGGAQTVNLSSLVDHDWYEVGGTSAPNSITDNIYTQGKVGIGISTLPGEMLSVKGNIRIGGSNAENYIAFHGTSNDGPNAYIHGFIGERIYANTESSELFIFKGNDANTASGPDRIRLASADIAFDTYSLPLSGSFSTVASSSLLVNRMMIKDNGNVGVGTSSPNTKLHIAGNVRVGLLNPPNTGTYPDYGNRLYFSGGPSGIGNSDATDPLWIARYNILHDESQLRINIGDNNNGQDALVVGAILTGGGGVFTSVFEFKNNGVATKPGGGTWTTISDKRTKKDVVNFTDGLEILEQINPVTFKYNGLYQTIDDGVDYVGIIAQDVQEVAPYMVGSYMAPRKNETDPREKILNYDGGTYMIYVLVNSVKELQENIRNLEVQRQMELSVSKKEIEDLKKEIEDLKSSNKKIKL